jgi:hypothetical protein
MASNISSSPRIKQLPLTPITGTKRGPGVSSLGPFPFQTGETVLPGRDIFRQRTSATFGARHLGAVEHARRSGGPVHSGSYRYRRGDLGDRWATKDTFKVGRVLSIC